VSTELPQRLAQPLPDNAVETEATPADSPSGKSDKQKSAKRAERRRGIETLFRVTYQNHIALSQLADQKAGMLISINGLIISVIIALLTPRLGSWSWTFAPGFVLVAGCLVSLAFAVIGSRPRVDRTPVTVDDVRNGAGNLLFFGHFTNMPLDDFQAAVRLLGKDRKLLHDSLSRQLHAMGEALLNKYRYVGIAYTAFLATVGFAALLFAALFIGLAVAA
jgi:hypothetical protein